MGLVLSFAKLIPSGFATTCHTQSDDNQQLSAVVNRSDTDLVGDDHGDAELLGQPRQLPQKLRQVHLPASQSK